MNKIILSSLLAILWTGQAWSISLEGNVEGEDFYFQAPQFSKLKSDCENWHTEEAVTHLADDIYLSVNGGGQEHLHNNPSYWGTASEVCDQIIRHAKKLANEDTGPTRKTRRLKIEGRIEESPFIFQAKALRGIRQQCTDFHESENITTHVDDIYVSVNGKAEKHLRNDPSYWETANDVCKQIIQYLESLNLGKNQQEKRCGNHALGDIYFEVKRQNPVIEKLNCRRGHTGQIIVKKQRLVEYTCTRRGPLETGEELVGQEVERQNNCRRVPKKPCNHPRRGQIAHGSEFEQLLTERVSKTVACNSRRGQQKNIYRKVVVKKCNNGKIKKVRETLKLEKAGKCEVRCRKAYGTTRGVSHGMPDEHEEILFAELPGDTKTGVVVKVDCRHLVKWSTQGSAPFRCNKRGFWEPAWGSNGKGELDLICRGTDDEP